MPRPKGTPNKPKEALDPGLANLATIALDMNLDESVRQEAAQALKTAMEPPAPEPTPTAPWYSYDTCPCDPFSDVGWCDNCRAYLSRERVKYLANQRDTTAQDTIDLSQYGDL